MILCTLCPACQTRAIIQALKMGLRVLMLDMDASPNGPALRPDGLLKDNDLMYTITSAAAQQPTHVGACVIVILIQSWYLRVCLSLNM